MMKKPTTKKLPEKQVARTVTAKGKPFMKLFSDEKILPISKIHQRLCFSVRKCHFYYRNSSASVNTSACIQQLLIRISL